MKQPTVVFISSMLPSGHFSQILTSGIAQNNQVKVIVYTDINPKNKEIKGCGTIKLIWPKNWRYAWYILRQLHRDKPDIVHIQQELNMYGGTVTILLFPFLVFAIRLLGIKTVVTIHAAVYKRQITKKFIHLFTIKRSFIIQPVSLTLLFSYIFSLTSLAAHTIVVHTEMMKDILVSDWYVDPGKIVVIPTGIPKKQILKTQKSPYFFYFGYMVRRKGLEYLLEGFKRFHVRYSQYKLVLAGGTIPGQEAALDEIKDDIHKLGITDAVRILGFVEDADLSNVYSQALAVVIPAKVSMGSSGPLYHAQSYGKCIIASKVGHFLEDIHHLQDGILTPNGSWDKALEFAVKNPDIISQIERNVKRKLQEKGIDIISRKYIDLYHHLASVDESRHFYSHYQ